MALDSEAYLGHLQALLPQGAVWPREPDATLTRLLHAWADELARVDARADDLVDEADPRGALELLAEWERAVGLPDDCTQAVAETLQARRTAVVERLTARGGQSIAFFKEVAAALGYTVAIEEYRPFIAGRSRTGDILNGPHKVRHTWRVAVPDARVSLFRAGANQTGDHLGDIERADDLECRLGKLKPAQSELVFNYEGV